MKYIKKVQIIRFRSIQNEVIDFNDLTLFSGRNNVGKSNVLKALNLFFNNESGFKQAYKHEHDYNIAFIGQAGGKREISIEVFFEKFGTGALKDDFSIIKKFSQNGDITEEFKSVNQKTQRLINERNGNTLRQFTAFKNKLNYIYIPAVRDKRFVSTLLLLFEDLIRNNAKQKIDFVDNINKLSSSLKNLSNVISSDFEKFIDLPAHASLSTNILDVLGAIKINVDSGVRTQRKGDKGRVHPQYVDLFSSGDGILMSYVPHFLCHLSKSLNNRNFIWGFEEPENSLEYSVVQKLSQQFVDRFLKYSQIVVTTHSSAFIDLRSKDTVSLYRAYKDPDKKDLQRTLYRHTDEMERRQRSLFRKGEIGSVEYELLSEELAYVEQSLDLEKFFNEAKSQRETEKTKIEKLMKCYGKQKAFFVEDSYTQIYKIAWLKLNDIDFTSDNLCEKFNDNADFEIHGQESASSLCGFLRSKNVEFIKSLRIVGLFDFDKEGSEKFYHLKKDSFWEENILGDLESGFFKKRKDHDCFYSMLLPIPDRLKMTVTDIKSADFSSLVEVENLLPERYLLDAKLVDKKEKYNGAIKYLKIKPQKKSKLWEGLVGLEKQAFVDFSPLYKSVEGFLA